MAANSVPTGLLEVGRVGKPHGVRGDLHVFFTTNRDERWAVGAQLWIAGDWRTITASKPQVDHFICHFADFDVREDSARLTNAAIFAEPIADPEALWVHEMIGAQVVEVNGTERGVCVAVLDNPAGPIMELDSGALVPAIFVKSLDEGVAVVDVPDGLFELGDDDED